MSGSPTLARLCPSVLGLQPETLSTDEGGHKSINDLAKLLSNVLLDTKTRRALVTQIESQFLHQTGKSFSDSNKDGLTVEQFVKEHGNKLGFRTETAKAHRG
eukprot:TRINITY_DN1646_c0_g1_i1.p1 TRINITY_DN1646_c0_g1~~TRINITY_DN1646_c0_g1_i1.p1  ORF type:complete len:102 (+),score=20.71 TRINITY_DN1646_c0_g1_i1:61-366(+)